MVEKKVIITHKVGLHARPASVFVQTAAKFASDITVACEDRTVRKSTLFLAKIKYLIDHFLPMIKQRKHGKVIEPTSRKMPKINLRPNIRSLLINILYKCRNMPTKHLKRHILIKTRSLQTIDNSLLMFLWIINQIIKK